MIWIWISVLMLSIGGFLSLLEMQKTIKIVTSIIIIFILVVFYLSLNRNTNYNTENLVGNKLNQIKLESLK